MLQEPGFVRNVENWAPRFAHNEADTAAFRKKCTDGGDKEGMDRKCLEDLANV